MSGHSKWSTIKHKKAAVDAKRGKIFSRYSKEITLAVRAGGKDAEMNPRLRTALAAAKTQNMPNDNIDRAIKKGAGELQGAVIEELNFEGYAPGGVGIVVTALSDNRNRTAAEIRNIFTKNNGSMAATGAVAWQFHRKARFTVEGAGLTEDSLLETLLNAGVDVEDVTCQDGIGEVTAPPEAFADVAKALEAAKLKVSESSIAMVPENMTEATEEGLARQAVRLIDALEDNDDVQAVYHNLCIPDEMAEKLAS
ncbi:MAG: YebC/PmpR family DNA-binding transcriptional regulator [Lentisphaeria bacterium]|jgi:YebC/PmpR family DNA-binding regulatory protein